MKHSASGQSTADDAASPPQLPPVPVHRAMVFIHDNAGRPITVADIAAAAGVSVRALQDNFRRHYDTTPVGYLQSVRLEHVHRDLQAADPSTGDTVAAIAARWQFTHLSHFAAAYRRAYGRTPRHTLRTSPGTSPPAPVKDPVAARPPARYGSAVGISREHRTNTHLVRANERDRIADERDRAADERDRIADERDKRADQRERRLDALEERLRDHLQRLGVQTDDLIAASRETIQRSKEAADRSLAHIDRSTALLASEELRAEREQTEVEHEIAASWRMLEE